MKFGLTLCCQVFPTSLPDSKNKNVKLHNPSFVAQQFRFSQAILAPYSLDLKVQLCGSLVWPFFDLEYFLNENEEKQNLYSPLDFENSFFPTLSFIDWWIEYYKSQCQKILVYKDILIANFLDPSLQKGTTSSKTKVYIFENPSIRKVL